jgi:hypothetical protein
VVVAEESRARVAVAPEAVGPEVVIAGLAALTQMLEWRNKRDGSTGIAMNGCGSRKSDTVYEERDISATSDSRWHSVRKSASPTDMSS